MVIIADGPYGLGGAGDLKGAGDLPAWYEPHVRHWTAKATALTTLWFWNTEIGWATVHPVLARHGWIYRQCCIWDKGLTHAANQTNTQNLRKLPTVTEVCVQYIRPPELHRREGAEQSLQAWLRSEWFRSGLPTREANRACGCGDMARRRYLVGDGSWYCPPPAMFARMAAHANRFGNVAGRPYFSIDGVKPLTARQWASLSRSATGGMWDRQRGKFKCEAGLTNVWRCNPVRGAARIKLHGQSAHPNQKPLLLMERILRLSSHPGDLVWEPFGGLFTGALAAARLGRRCVAAEAQASVYGAGVLRLEKELGSAALRVEK